MNVFMKVCVCVRRVECFSRLRLVKRGGAVSQAWTCELQMQVHACREARAHMRGEQDVVSELE